MNKRIIAHGASRKNKKTTFILFSKLVSAIKLFGMRLPKKHLYIVAGLVAVVIGLLTILPSQNEELQRSEIPLIIDAYPSPNVNGTSNVVLSASSDASSKSSGLATLAKISNHSKGENLTRMVGVGNDAFDSDLGRWYTTKIKPGDNLSTIFSKQGLGASVTYNITRVPTLGKKLSTMRPGEVLEFRINESKELTQLRYVQSQLKSIFFSKTELGGYKGEVVELEPQVRVVYKHGEIVNSLFLASQKAGLSDNLTMKLAKIFGWDIDFVQDIRSGDSFNLVYEEKYLHDRKLEDGNILAATFTNRGKTYTAVRYDNSKGEVGYYAPDGKSMKKAFLRTPVDFTRISSRFNPHRLHPVFKTKRPHRGVDYAAMTNTPIKSAGAGRVKFVGWQRGYGKVVYIQHPNNIVTVYAHQNKFPKGLKKGQQVKQGQIIGYVGKTGWATGPHLHYEFRVNGSHRNPMTVKLPDASPIKRDEMARFKLHSSKILAHLERASETLLAKN